MSVVAAVLISSLYIYRSSCDAVLQGHAFDLAGATASFSMCNVSSSDATSASTFTALRRGRWVHLTAVHVLGWRSLQQTRANVATRACFATISSVRARCAYVK